MSALDDVLEVYRDMLGVKTDRANEIHRLPRLEYLIRTYTDKNDLVLDNTMGFGSTMVACKKGET